ncbi:hypothetical protein K9M79_02480 [Candidatus Woesearchaeota archaeon]|nr:hypothetical protein [Candidatus Woesearchaeota archaeon]
MSLNDKAMSIIRRDGPILPSQIAKGIGTNILLAGAVLSELSSQKQIKVSSLKVGGSPLYYVQGQESRLENYAKHLNEKDKKAFDVIKERKVVADSALPPLFQVAMRSISDFAVPIEVEAGSTKHIFWKFYNVTREEATEIVRAFFSPGAKTEEKSPEKIVQPVSKQEIKIEKGESFIQTSIHAEGESKQAKKEVDDDFYGNIKSFCDKNKIEIVSFDIIRKNSEIDLVLSVPTAVGNVGFYTKAKNKKTINDGDISSAILTAESKKMPLVFITTGKMTKKAEDMLSSLNRSVNFINL